MLHFAIVAFDQPWVAFSLIFSHYIQESSYFSGKAFVLAGSLSLLSDFLKVLIYLNRSYNTLYLILIHGFRNLEKNIFYCIKNIISHN